MLRISRSTRKKSFVLPVAGISSWRVLRAVTLRPVLTRCSGSSSGSIMGTIRSLPVGLLPKKSTTCCLHWRSIGRSLMSGSSLSDAQLKEPAPFTRKSRQPQMIRVPERTPLAVSRRQMDKVGLSMTIWSTPRYDIGIYPSSLWAGNFHVRLRSVTLELPKVSHPNLRREHSGTFSRL